MNNEPNCATNLSIYLDRIELMSTDKASTEGLSTSFNSCLPATPSKPFDFNFTDQDTEITITNKNGHLVLSNGCRVKLINGREVLPIKEKFKINKRLKLVNALNQKQINQLWFSYQHDPALL